MDQELDWAHYWKSSWIVGHKDREDTATSGDIVRSRICTYIAEPYISHLFPALCPSQVKAPFPFFQL